MDFLTPLIVVMKCLWEPIVRRFGYIKNLDRNFEKLNKEARDLYNRREDVTLEIDRSTTEKITTNECKGWLDEVEKIENQLNDMGEEYQEDKKCLRGCCPDVYSRMKLAERVQNMIGNVTDLKEKSKFEGGIVVDAPPEVAGMMLAPTIEIETSSDHTLQNILRCIRDVGIKKIGIWGMGGIGKTTVMKNLNWHPEMAQMFEIIIWVTVSKEWSTRKIQNQITQRVGLKVEDFEPDHLVALRLFKYLKTEKFLLLLDDVWDIVDLDSVGIPAPSVGNDCKVVLTTRYRNVCHKMRTDVEVKVEVLSQEESWQLFCKEVGNVADHPSIAPLAKHIVQECGGLPLAIIVVGGALRKEDDVHVWSNALTELRSPATSWIEEMEEEVFRRLKFSYDRLKDDNTKKCFLYVALYPEDHPIEVKELIEYWRAEGFLNGAQNLAQARDKGHSILKKLIDSSLLSGYPNAKFVRVHDVIRDMALRLTSTKGEECRFLARAGVGMEEPPIEDEWKEVKRISLMNNQLLGLPEKPECSMLSALLLQQNSSLIAIPDSFFKHMCTLRVLDLSSTCIKSLPPSLGNLVNLHGLYLNDCRDLSGLPSQVGALKRLEVLHLRCTSIEDEGLLRCRTRGIKFLPAEIGELTCLGCLEVSFSRYNVVNDIPIEDLTMAMTPDGIFSRPWIREDDGSLWMLDNIDMDKPQMIPGGVLSKLSLLEELRIDMHLREERWNLSVAEALMAVCSLKELTTLDFHFPRVEYLEHFIQSSRSWKRGLTAFRFSVGHHVALGYFSDDSAGTYEHERCNRCLIYQGAGSVSHAVAEVLNYADGFHIEGNNNIPELSEFGVENMNRLTLCFIRECNEMASIINGTGIQEVALPNLKNLFIWHLPKLRSFWEGPVQVGSLVSLRVLHLTGCPMLQKAFSMDMVRQLSNLQDLFVRDCSSIEEIFDDREVEMAVDYEDLLPKLWNLDLRDLPQLARISKPTSLSWQLLRTITIEDCLNLKNLPFDRQNAERLSIIEGEREWWDVLEWEDEDTKLLLQPKFYKLSYM
ncbi:disease resistance protein RPS5-like [Magnolia sinica]|uniref:disease resistance protein RPS5-like n=1 Tax=Magnolia sinica TaxID=86752 RepID=UPI00265A1655|nr:disease resistance protein RPS5-like [Magnolia sinica]XP_058108043.1 disease resistance protein RPS5-like [Magnolia sinica]